MALTTSRSVLLVCAVSSFASLLVTTHQFYRNALASPNRHPLNDFALGSVPVSYQRSPVILSEHSDLPVKYLNDSLFIHGVRLTTSISTAYRDKDDKLHSETRKDESETVFFDMFAHGIGFRTNVNGIVHTERSNESTYAYTKEHDESDDNPLNLACQLQGDGNSPSSPLIPMKLVPADKSKDKNSKGWVLIWRCNLQEYVLKADLLRMLPTDSLKVALWRNVETASTTDSPPLQNDERQQPEHLTTFSVPISTGVLGTAGPTIRSKRKDDGKLASYLHQVKDRPMRAILCLVGVQDNAIHSLPEHVQHHLNVGFGQVFVGLNGAMDSEAVRLASELLNPYLEDGSVAITGAHMLPGRHEKADYNHRKLNQYTSCLLHAKGMAEYVVNLDIDEMWMPSPKIEITMDSDQLKDHPMGNDPMWRRSAYARRLSLPQSAERLFGPNNCSDWCYQVYPSYRTGLTGVSETTLHGKPADFGSHGLIERAISKAHQKPIIRTKFAHLNSWHLGGACLDKTNGLEQYVNQFESCPMQIPSDYIRDTAGSIYHYRTYRAHRVKAMDPEIYHDNEYLTSGMRETTLAQLKSRYKAVHK